jgi:hypothetical protein
MARSLRLCNIHVAELNLLVKVKHSVKLVVEDTEVYLIYSIVI